MRLLFERDLTPHPQVRGGAGQAAGECSLQHGMGDGSSTSQQRSWHEHQAARRFGYLQPQAVAWPAHFCSILRCSLSPQYAAFYRWMQQEFQANAVLHFGMHGTGALAGWRP